MHQRANRCFKPLGSILLVFLLCQALPALGAQDGTDTTVTGEVTVLYADDFENKRSELIYRLREMHGDRTFNLHVPEKAKKKLKTGTVIKVRGKAKGRELYLPADGAAQQVETVLPAAAAISGEQRTIVILANFNDAGLSCSANEVRDLMFTDSNDTSVDDLYQETSLGEIWFAGDVAGPYTIDYWSTGSCSTSAWGSALDAAAQADGFNISAYNRKVYVIPRSNPCGWAGIGTVGGNPSRSWIFRCGIPDVYAHELGHNLGMHHASTKTSEYGDTSDIMGYGGLPLRQINAPHQEQMGWRAPAQIQTVTASGEYDVAPLELYPFETVAPQVLKIAPDTGDSYYLSYRQPIGFDNNLRPEYLDGLAVHRHNGNGGKTYYLATLVDGESYVDTTNGMTFTQISHSAQAVIVDIQIDGSSPECGDSVCNGEEDFCSCPGDCGTPPAEICDDGLDNDCDGLVDGDDVTDCPPPGPCDDFVPVPTACGVGECRSTGTTTCNPVTGAIDNTCTPGDPTREICDDGLDNDCDGVPDCADGDCADADVCLPDTEPPTAPGGLWASVMRKHVNLTWVASTDNVGVTRYKVWRDGAMIGETAEASYTDRSIARGTTYSYTVTALDTAGNVSAHSNAVSVTLTRGRPRKGRRK